MEFLINTMIVVSLAAVVASLGLGLVSLARGGEFARANSNKFMRWRVGAQFIAILFLTIGLLYKASH